MLQSDRRNLSMMMDFYEMTMGYGYFRSQKPCNRVIFDFFYRQNPDNGGYAIFAGLEQIIDYLVNLHFEDDVFLTEDLMFSAPAIVRAERIAFVADPLIFHREGTGENIMAKKDSHPIDFIRAFSTFKAFLEDEGIMNDLRIGYTNWALDGIVHNVQTLNTYEGFCTAVQALTEGGGLRNLGLNDVDESDLHEEVFRQFLAWIKTTPNELLYRQFISAREEQGLLSNRLCIEYRINREKQAYIDDLEHQLAKRDEEIAWRRGEMEALQSEFEAQMNAAEQKVGKAICWVPRRIQEALSRGPR